MNLFKMVEQMTKKMKWYDFSLFKLTMLAFSFFLVTVWPELDTFVHSVAWYVWLIIGIVLAIPLWKKML